MMTAYKKRRLSAKITGIILILELFIFILSVAISYVVIHPDQLEKAVTAADVSNKEMASQINTTLVNLTNSSSYFISSKELQTALNNYYEDKNNMTWNQLRLSVSNLIESMTYVAGVVIDGEEDMQVSSINALADQDLEFLSDPLYNRIRTTPHMSGYSSIYQV